MIKPPGVTRKTGTGQVSHLSHLRVLGCETQWQHCRQQVLFSLFLSLSLPLMKVRESVTDPLYVLELPFYTWIWQLSRLGKVPTDTMEENSAEQQSRHQNTLERPWGAQDDWRLGNPDPNDTQSWQP